MVGMLIKQKHHSPQNSPTMAVQVSGVDVVMVVELLVQQQEFLENLVSSREVEPGGGGGGYWGPE